MADIALEVDLYVVSPDCLSTPVIIGTDVLNRDGVTYVRTKGKHYLARTKDDPIKVLTIESSEGIPISTPLQGAERERLLEMITEFSVFLITGTAESTVTTGSMPIRLTSDTPVSYRPYKLSHQEKLRVRDIIRDLLDKGIIRESESAYASPILLVKKRDGTDRLVIDFRALNHITVKDRYPLPLIEDQIDRLGSSEYFTILDMATGFYQIPIDAESVHKTGFVTPEGHYEFLKMPFGLANAPVVFQRIITNTLRSFIDTGKVLVYTDDILILSQTTDEGIETLRQVMLVLTSAGFSINIRKCKFLTTEIEYLGRVISRGQVRPSPRKIEAIVNAPTPSNLKKVRQFLGLAGHFRRYIAGDALKTACIAHLTRKDAKFDWGVEQENARKELIAILTSDPVLAIFDPILPTEVHTDASSLGYGAVLIQTHTGNYKRVVAYFSKGTQGAQSRYHSYELETLAVVKALENFRHYLIGIQFKVVTDCNALKSTQRKKDLVPRVARWWAYLQDFTFTIEYRKGVMMAHADYLSRNPVNLCRISKPCNWAQIAQAADEKTQGLIQQLADGQLDQNRYSKQKDLLYYKYTPIGEQSRLLCFIPKGHRLSLLRIFHDEHGHVGVEKTTDLILKHFWFPGLRQFVKKYVSHCLVCLSHKRQPRAPLQPITSWDKPDLSFDTIHVDVLGPLAESEGYKFVLILVDAFSKYCLMYPIYRQDLAESRRVITNAVSLFGTPKLIVADRGRMFDNPEFASWVNELGSDIHLITPGMHQSNGQVERYCRTVLNLIRIKVNHRRTEWSSALWKLQLILNITKQKTTQTSALNLLIGTDSTTPIIRALVRDVALEGSHPNREGWREICRQRASQLLKDNRDQQDVYVNQRRKPPRKFQDDDMVFVIKSTQATGKLDSGMRGPYRVSRP